MVAAQTSLCHCSSSMKSRPRSAYASRMRSSWVSLSRHSLCSRNHSGCLQASIMVAKCSSWKQGRGRSWCVRLFWKYSLTMVGQPPLGDSIIAVNTGFNEHTCARTAAGTQPKKIMCYPSWLVCRMPRKVSGVAIGLPCESQAVRLIGVTLLSPAAIASVRSAHCCIMARRSSRYSAWL